MTVCNHESQRSTTWSVGILQHMQRVMQVLVVGGRMRARHRSSQVRLMWPRVKAREGAGAKSRGLGSCRTARRLLFSLI